MERTETPWEARSVPPSGFDQVDHRVAEAGWLFGLGASIAGIVLILALAPSSVWPVVVVLAIAVLACAAMASLSTRHGRETLLDVHAPGTPPNVVLRHGMLSRGPMRPLSR